MTRSTTAYQCNESGVLVGETMVQECPFTPGIFLLPPGCTLVPPPEFDQSTGEAVYADGAWNVRRLPVTTEHRSTPVPELATELNRPPVEENQMAVVVNGRWKIKADFRGATYWLEDGTKHTIVDLDEKPPVGARFSPPPGKRD